MIFSVVVKGRRSLAILGADRMPWGDLCIVRDALGGGNLLGVVEGVSVLLEVEAGLGREGSALLHWELKGMGGRKYDDLFKKSGRL